MAVLSKEDFLKAVQTRIGEDTSDEAMKFIEDMTDTFDSLTKAGAGDGEDWEAKYNELDKSWREKYKARFFEGANTQSSNETTSDGVKKEQQEDVKEDGEEVSFDDLFEEREG